MTTLEDKTIEQIELMLKYFQMRRHPQLRDYSDYSVLSIMNGAMATMIYMTAQLIVQKKLDLSILTATGAALDELVRDRLPEGRLPGTKAVGVLKFSRRDAAGVDIVIPAGTLVARDVDEGQPVYFLTTEEATLTAGNLMVYVDAQAQNIGNDGNVPAYTIKRIASPVAGIHGVDNELEFSGGTDSESDTDLKSRYIYTVLVPGRATISMVKEHVEAVTDNDNERLVLESAVFTLGGGDVQVVVDAPFSLDEQPEAIWQSLRENLAGGSTAVGVIGARLSPEGNQFELDDCSGGKIWVRPTETTELDENISIEYVDILGRTRTATVIVPHHTYRGKAIEATLQDESDWAARITDSPYVGNNKYDVMMGIGPYPYMYVLPEHQQVSSYMAVRFTETPEIGLAAKLEDSIRAKLNAYKIGEDLEYSDVSKFTFIDFATRDEFSGIDEIVAFRLVCKGVTLDTNGGKVDIENDERLEAGSTTIDVLE